MKSKPVEFIRDIDTRILYLHAKDTGIYPLIIAMGEVRVMISRNYPDDVLDMHGVRSASCVAASRADLLV